MFPVAQIPQAKLEDVLDVILMMVMSDF